MEQETRKTSKRKVWPYALGIGCGLVCYGIGCAAGIEASKRVFSKGLDRMWNEDPTLKDHMVNVATNIYRKQLEG